MIDGFFMNSPENLDDKFFAQSFFSSLFNFVPQDFIPPACLQDGDIILLFVFSDLSGNRHTMFKDIHELFIIFINFMPQIFEC